VANKPVLHAHDHQHGGADPVRITWESTGEAGTGGAIMFDTDPQTGNWLMIETTEPNPTAGADGSSMMLKSAGDIEIQNTTDDSTGHIHIFGDNDVEISAFGDGGVQIAARGDGSLVIRADSGTSAQVEIIVAHGSGQQLRIFGLPSSNPDVPGGSGVWRDADGFLRIG
jgi:hypothetical protein